LCSSGRTSGRSGQAEHQPEKRVICPRTSSTASLTMPGQGCPRLPMGLARTWLRQQYYFERCRSHPPPRGGVSRENSRISWRMPRSDGLKALPPEGRGTPPPRSIVPRLPDSCGKPRSTQGARGTQRLQPRVASATSTTAATVEPTSMRRCTEATTPGMGDATTTGRIGVPRPNHPVRKLSAGPYDRRRSRPGSGPRLPSPSTRGRRDRNCGSRTTGWPASWMERTMTTSSSATSPCSSLTPPEPGWSICLLRRSPTGTTWSKPSPETSRAHTCVLGTPGISEAAASSRESPYGTTSGDSRSSISAAQHHRLRCHRRVPRRHHLSRPGEQARRKTPTRASELMDIATKFASGQEAVQAIFRKDKQP
jgi:hypothetical protein